VAQEQGAPDKASAGWPIPGGFEASAAYGGLIGRPSRASRDRPYPERTPSSEVQTVGPPGPGCGSCLMVFVREVLAPGPGTRPKATFRWRPFQSARGRVSSTLSGSLFFIPPPLVEVMIYQPADCRGMCSGGRPSSTWPRRGWRRRSSRSHAFLRPPRLSFPWRVPIIGRRRTGIWSDLAGFAGLRVQEASKQLLAIPSVNLCFLGEHGSCGSNIDGSCRSAD
jgi:hypothetical protein